MQKKNISKRTGCGTSLKVITSIYKQECAAAQADADEHAEDVDSDEGASSPLAAVKSLPESIKMSTRGGGGARRFRNDASSDVLKTKEPAYLTSGLMRRRGKLIKKQRSVTAQRLPLQEAIKNGNSKILDTSKNCYYVFLLIINVIYFNITWV